MSLKSVIITVSLAQVIDRDWSSASICHTQRRDRDVYKRGMPVSRTCSLLPSSTSSLQMSFIWPAPRTFDATVEENPAGTKTGYARVDEVYDEAKRTWTLRDSAPYEPKATNVEEKGPYHDHCFLLKHRYEIASTTPKISIVIQSTALRDTIHNAANDNDLINLYTGAPEIPPEKILPYYYILSDALDKASVKASRDGNDLAIKQLAVFLDFLRSEFASYFSTIEAQLANMEISFEYLRSILIPGREFYTTDALTGLPRIVTLQDVMKHQSNGMWFYQLKFEYLETYANFDSENASMIRGRFGRASLSTVLNEYRGPCKIHSFQYFPLEYHAMKDDIRRALITRGKKWASYDGLHHVTYNGIGYKGQAKQYLKGRAIIDKSTFRRINHGGPVPDKAYMNEYDAVRDEKEREADGKTRDENGLTDDDYVLATPLLYGFALGNKQWAAFNVELVEEIVWNDEAFANLVLPPEKKSLIQALVEAHSSKTQSTFDDFIAGKGQGLVINLFGPPGVGKTMSAEATSEHLRKPLYVVGAGDLGTNAASLDAKLSQIFDIGHSWNAVVLIDEADVFLEERSVHDLDRNALVAVFLRQLEYFAGILFLTTNRVKTFDPAFASRIHVALRYNDLDGGTKDAIWKAFLGKVRVADTLGEKEWEILKTKNVNGRQIKNAVKTAQALAHNQRENLTFKHINHVLEMMEQFERDLETIKVSAISAASPQDDLPKRRTKRSKMYDDWDEEEVQWGGTYGMAPINFGYH